MKDYGYVLREYEQNGLDVKFKFYKRDCHSVITAEDLASVQFQDGQTFSENGSELAFDVLKKVRKIEEFIKQNPQNALCKRYLECYQDVCQLGYSEAEKAAEALADLEVEMQQEKSSIFSKQPIGENKKIMKELDVRNCEFDNPESCYHLTRAVHESSIAEHGLGADIGIRSKDGVGNEKTSKVFFAKSLEGTLIFLNRNFNIFRDAVKHNNFSRIKGALKDDSPELYEQIFKDMIHENMSDQELDNVAMALGKLYLERGIYYKLDLKHCTKEEFEKMSELEKDEIDYFSNDINEERPDEHPAINNMHTRTGRGVNPSKMKLMTSGRNESALDIAVSMGEFFKSLHPEQSLPVLEHKDGSKDKPLLEMLIQRIKEQEQSVTFSEQQIGKTTVNTPTTKKSEAQKQVARDEQTLQQDYELSEND